MLMGTRKNPNCKYWSYIWKLCVLKASRCLHDWKRLYAREVAVLAPFSSQAKQSCKKVPPVMRINAYSWAPKAAHPWVIFPASNCLPPPPPQVKIKTYTSRREEREKTQWATHYNSCSFFFFPHPLPACLLSCCNANSSQENGCIFRWSGVSDTLFSYRV